MLTLGPVISPLSILLFYFIFITDDCDWTSAHVIRRQFPFHQHSSSFARKDSISLIHGVDATMTSRDVTSSGAAPIGTFPESDLHTHLEFDFDIERSCSTQIDSAV